MSQFPNHPDPTENDDDFTYEDDEWQDLEGDRDVHNDSERLMSLVRRGYFN